MQYLLSLDQGTTSSRALVFDTEGNIKGLAQQAFKQHFPQPGWVEHNPNDIIKTQFDVLAEALNKAGIKADAVAAIGITNQRETCLLWDRQTGEALTPALVWQDRRTADSCERMRAEGHSDTVYSKTGLLIDPYFSASKLAWLLEHDAQLKQRAERGEIAFGTIDSWLVYQLSDGAAHITDATNAARTMLYNIHLNEWDDELLGLWQVPRAVLPRVVDSSGVVATTTRFGGDIPIAGIAGDQQAALFGQACFEPGMAKCTYGTGCFLLMHTGQQAVQSQSRLLSTIACRRNGVTDYALEGSVFMGGATIQWLRDGLGIIASAAAVEDLAAQTATSDGVVLVPAFTGLGAPHWDAQARALLIGMTRGTGRAQIARAALEAIAYQVSEVSQAMATDANIKMSELRVDGGASENRLLMQMQADQLQTSIIRPKISESTAYGAAMLAGLGVGLFNTQSELAERWHQRDRFTPHENTTAITQGFKRWREAVKRCRGWAEFDDAAT